MAYTLSNRLPDPSQRYTYWGDDPTAPDANYNDTGPGFSSVKLTSDQKMMMSRTNSQRVLSRAVAGQKWNIDIGYHPMTRTEFEPVNAFLLSRQGPLTPFFVSLPQYSTPRNAAWATVVDLVSAAQSAFTVTAAHDAGSKRVTFTVPTISPTYETATGVITNIPAQGDIINISDANDTNHTKAYMITAVETRYANYDDALTEGDGDDFSKTLRITLNPPLVRAVTSVGAVTFKDPLFKVILPQAVREYSLNTDNLYKFGLKLEEYL